MVNRWRGKTSYRSNRDSRRVSMGKGIKVSNKINTLTSRILNTDIRHLDLVRKSATQAEASDYGEKRYEYRLGCGPESYSTVKIRNPD